MNQMAFAKIKYNVMQSVDLITIFSLFIVSSIDFFLSMFMIWSCFHYWFLNGGLGILEIL